MYGESLIRVKKKNDAIIIYINLFIFKKIYLEYTLKFNELCESNKKKRRRCICLLHTIIMINDRLVIYIKEVHFFIKKM